MKQEILNELEKSFLSQDKICTKLLALFQEEQNFILDSTGINIDELEYTQTRIRNLVDKLVSNLNNLLNHNILQYAIDFKEHLMIFNIKLDNLTFDVKIIVESDGFLMEIHE